MSVYVETTGNIKKAELKWDFPNVNSLKWKTKEPGETIYSPEFHADGDDNVKWCIEICPNGETEETKGWIAAFINSMIQPASRPTVDAQVKLTAVFDKERKKVWSDTVENIFDPHMNSFSWRIVKLAEVLNSNFFSLVCQVEYSDPNPTTKVSMLPRPSVPLINEEPTSSVVQDLEQLFNNRSGTDVCFVIEGKEITAHKLILSTRSPVFAAMVESGMRESIENRVEINDITPDIFEALLRFVYTDRVDLAHLDAQDLLVAANKYMLPLLKLECQNFLSERLTIENCVEMLALSDLHNCVHLKRSAVNFILRNRDGVMESDGWKDLKQSRPDLAITVFESLL